MAEESPLRNASSASSRDLAPGLSRKTNIETTTMIGIANKAATTNPMAAIQRKEWCLSDIAPPG
jgi:hypothetical protein